MGSPALSNSKNEIRNAIRRQRRALGVEQVACLSRSIAEHAKRFQPLLMARIVALYLPIDREVDGSSLLLYLDTLGKKLCLPVVEPERRLRFALYRPGDPLYDNRFGIPEPQRPAWLGMAEIDVVILPLVGFDADGRRLGYGGGYYDRFLAENREMSRGKRPVLVGLAYDFQEVPRLPDEAHDVPLHYVVTQSGVRSFL